MQINMQSTVVYDASQGYDEDTWDDSALIKAYDLAKESSRCSVTLMNILCVAEFVIQFNFFQEGTYLSVIMM